MNVRDAAQRTLIIRPLARLQTGARYGVAIRNTVKSATGGELPISEGFAAARDGDDFDHPLWEQTTAGFDALFARLEAQGVTRDQLVLAWDFVVASDAFLRNDLSSMVSQALPAMGTDGANLSFTITEEKPPGASYRLYVGTFKSPNFLTNGETDASEMVRDANGVPQMQGMRDANFAAIIPACVATQPLPRPTILFGHGLFGGSEDYLDDGFVQDIAEDYCFVVIAGDFIGLTMRQLALAPLAANDGNKAHWISDKLSQSVVDFIALEHAIRGPMRGAPEFAYQGAPVINASRVYYLGGSLGGIMGNTFMAYDPNITRGVLAVPGGNWSMLFERSSAWTILSGALAGSYPDPGVQQMLVAMMGMTLERVDPMTTASKVLADPMPGVPPKNILMWMAIGDSLVTNLATEMTARTMGIDVVGPSVKQPWGMDVMAATMPNGLVVIDEHRTPMPSEFNMPEDDNGTHGGCNRRAALLRMTEQFVLQGDVVMGCEVGGNAAPCDCDTGACD